MNENKQQSLDEISQSISQMPEIQNIMDKIDLVKKGEYVDDTNESKNTNDIVSDNHNEDHNIYNSNEEGEEQIVEDQQEDEEKEEDHQEDEEKTAANFSDLGNFLFISKSEKTVEKCLRRIAESRQKAKLDLML
jgi:ABC-type Na+ transport system ATPase subunit NatA